MFLFQRRLYPCLPAPPPLFTCISTGSHPCPHQHRVCPGTRSCQLPPEDQEATSRRLPRPRRAPGASSDAMALIASLDATTFIHRGRGWCFRAPFRIVLAVVSPSTAFLRYITLLTLPVSPFTCLPGPWPCTLLFCECVGSCSRHRIPSGGVIVARATMIGTLCDIMLCRTPTPTPTQVRGLMASGNGLLYHAGWLRACSPPDS
ncbi:hypothetical protein LZ30DRAFT_201369 [Colletotrichum cereale]|nr:hypothetical protein LZ30DRAFT_201369 [Colletotrichum cereale]